MLEPESRRAERRRVAGLAVRTSNAEEAEPSTARIPALWERFTSEAWPEHLEQSGAVGPTVAVYSAYESDVSGSYQILVGREVRGSAPVAPPLQLVDMPQGRYLVFSCSGPLPGAVIEGWRSAWAFFGRPDAPARAYTADFEEYADHGRAEIWVAVRDDE